MLPPTSDNDASLLLAHVALASIADGVITADAEGRVRYLNPAAEALTGWNAGEAAGRPLGDVVLLRYALSERCDV